VKWEPLPPLGKKHFSFFKHFTFVKGLLENELRKHPALETSLKFMEEIAVEDFWCSRGIATYCLSPRKDSFGQKLILSCLLINVLGQI